MIKAWSFDSCVSVFNREIELLKSIFAAQEEVRQCVLSREWVDFDEKTEEVRRLGEEFALLEEERAQLFSLLLGKEDNSGKGDHSSESQPFYALISGLSLDEQRELSRLYRELKMETLKMRALNDNFLAYLNEAKAMAAAYIEAVYPARGGKLYTRKGRKVSQDLKSIVINSQF